MPDQENPMPEIKEITSHVVEDELHICPDCGYERGFHTSFISVQATRDTPVRSTRDVYRVILICPECGARYDIGWRITPERAGIPVVRTAGTPPE
jgi:hypothetical protein